MMPSPRPVPDVRRAETDGRSSPLARANACAAGIRSVRISSSSWPAPPTPPARGVPNTGGSATSAGTTSDGRNGSMSTVADESTVSLRQIIPTQVHANRDRAHPTNPKSISSCTVAGLSTGMCMCTKSVSDCCAVTVERALWSSPARARTPPCWATPW